MQSTDLAIHVPDAHFIVSNFFCFTALKSMKEFQLTHVGDLLMYQSITVLTFISLTFSFFPVIVFKCKSYEKLWGQRNHPFLEDVCFVLFCGTRDAIIFI